MQIENIALSKKIINQHVIKDTRAPILTSRLQHVVSLLVTGSLRGHSKDYVTDQVLSALRKKPTLQAHHDIGDFNFIKKNLVEPLYKNSTKHNRSEYLDLPSTICTMTIRGYQKPRIERNLPDPAVLERHRDELKSETYSFKEINGGQLYIDDISPNDIDQNDIGDCYFASALSAVAASHPEMIKKAIKDNHDGTYTVNLYKDSKRQSVTIDDDMFQSKYGTSIYDDSTNNKELWVGIMEKAYAKLYGGAEGYEKIGNGGPPTKAIQALTGMKANYISNSKNSSDKIYSYIQQGLDQKHPIVATTSDDPNKYVNTGIVENHAYTILGTTSEYGEKYVILRNPWSHGEWDGKGADTTNDGVFKMPIDQFKKLFGGVSMPT